MTGNDLLQLALAGGSAGGLSLGVVLIVARWTANFIAGRIDKREALLGEKQEKIDGAMQRLVGHLQAQVTDLIAHKEKVEKQLAECMERDIEKERRIAQLEGLTAGLGDARQHAQLIVSAEKRKEAKE